MDRLEQEAPADPRDGGADRPRGLPEVRAVIDTLPAEIIVSSDTPYGGRGYIVETREVSYGVLCTKRNPTWQESGHPDRHEAIVALHRHDGKEHR